MVSYKPSKSLCVLIAGGDEKSSIAMRDAFKTLGYRAYWAADGVTALDKVADITPDLIIIDMDIAELDAIAVCEAMQQEPDLAHAVYIAQGSDQMEETLGKIRRAGFNYFMRRPIDLPALQHLLGFESIAYVSDTRKNEDKDPSNLALTHAQHT